MSQSRTVNKSEEDVLVMEGDSKSTPKAKKPAKEKKPAVKKDTVKDWEGKSVTELKLELQKIVLDVRTGKQKNTSLVKKLKKVIARELTKKQ